MDLKEEFHRYARKRIADLEQAISMMETGILKTGQQSANGTREDTTSETLASYKQQLEELNELQQRMKKEWGEQ